MKDVIQKNTFPLKARDKSFNSVYDSIQVCTRSRLTLTRRQNDIATTILRKVNFEPTSWLCSLTSLASNFVHSHEANSMAKSFFRLVFFNYGKRIDHGMCGNVF